MQNYPVGKALDEVTCKNADLEWSCLQPSVGHVCLDAPSSVKQRNARGLQRQVGLKYRRCLRHFCNLRRTTNTDELMGVH